MVSFCSAVAHSTSRDKHHQSIIMAVSEGGYIFRFVGEERIRKELKCPICLLVLKTPHLTDCCGGDFCKSCIDGVKGQNKPCPLCREDFKTMINKKVEREVQLLFIYCVNSSKGCTWTGAIKDLNDHIADGNGTNVTANRRVGSIVSDIRPIYAQTEERICQYQDLRCPLGCGVYILRKDVVYHKKNICPQRPFECLHCGTKDTFTHISAKHYPICKQFPLQCPNACTKDTIPRGKMPGHLEVCPLQPVVCPYAKYGCKSDSSVVRRDHEKHLKDAVHTHLEMVTKSHEKLVEEVKQMSMDTSSLKTGKLEMKQMSMDTSSLKTGKLKMKQMSMDTSSLKTGSDHESDSALCVEIPLPLKMLHRNLKVIVKKGSLLPEVTDIKVVAICSSLGFNVGINKLLNDQLKGLLQQTVGRRYRNHKSATFNVFSVPCPPSTINCHFLVVVDIANRTTGTHQVHNKYLEQILHSVFKEVGTLELPGVAKVPQVGTLNSCYSSVTLMRPQVSTLKFPSVAIAPHTFRVGGCVDSIFSTYMKMLNQRHNYCEFLTDMRFLAPTSSMFEQLIFEAERFTDIQLLTSTILL